MISKELLNAVLGEELYLFHLWNIEDNELLYYTEANGGGKRINIYELAHKCKEWATFKNGKNIITERDISGVYSYIIFMIGITIHNEYLDDTTRILANFKADTELEAIFKACEYILNNIKQ